MPASIEPILMRVLTVLLLSLLVTGCGMDRYLCRVMQSVAPECEQNR